MRTLKNLWIIDRLGVPEKVLSTFCESAYMMNCNPLYPLRHWFPLVDFRFQASSDQKVKIEINEDINEIIVKRIKSGRLDASIINKLNKGGVK